ncbi:hypothetical protein HKD37_14G040497 [Glycine soja]
MHSMGPKSILRLIRTLGPFLASLVQSSWSLLSNALGGRIASKTTSTLLAGQQVFHQVKDIITIFGKTQKKDASNKNIWKKRSIFFYLPYLCDVDLSVTKMMFQHLILLRWLHSPHKCLPSMNNMRRMMYMQIIMIMMNVYGRILLLMETPLRPPSHSDAPLEATSKRIRSLDQPRPTINVNPATGRGSSPHIEKFQSYLGVGKFDIPEGSNAKTKGQDKQHPSFKYGLDLETWEEFTKSSQTPSWQVWRPWGIREKAQEIQKYNDCPHLLSRGGYDLLEKKLMEEKRKTRQQHAEFTEDSVGQHQSLCPHKKRLRTYLGIIARDKVDVTYDTWKEVPVAQKDLIWEDIQTEFEIPEAFDSRTKKKVLQIVGERWRKFKSDLTRKWALAADKDGVEDTQEEMGLVLSDPQRPLVRVMIFINAIQKQNTAPHMLSRGGYEYLEHMLVAKKTKKRLEEAAQSGSTEGVIDPPSPIKRYVKWKMAHTKKTGIVIIFVYSVNALDKYMCFVQDSLEEPTSNGSFDLLTAAIRQPKHPGRVPAAGANVTIKQYFGLAPRNSHSSSFMPPEELEQLTQQIRDQLEELITEKIQSQGFAMPPEPEVGPSATHVSTKGSCVDPSPTDPEMGDSVKYGLYIEDNPSLLVALGRLYEGSTAVHNIPLLHGQVKVGVEEVKDAEAPVPVPTDEVIFVGQALNTFHAWPTHLVKRPSEQATVSQQNLQICGILPCSGCLIKTSRCTLSTKISLKLHMVVNVSAYLLYSCGFCKSIYIIRSGKSQFELESYMKSWMQSSKYDVYLGAYLNGVLKGLDDTPQPKSKDGARWIIVKCYRQKGTTECGYYIMHWMSTIILGTFKNNWETYFNDVRPLEAERLKVLRIQRA